MVAVYDKQDYALQEITFTGEFATDNFSLGLAKYNRQVDFTQHFLQIKAFDKSKSHIADFHTDYSGYIGIAPWTADPDDKERNFLY
jgi:hypothetical protein